MTEMADIGFLDYTLAPDDQFQVTIDISDWLDTDQIQSVTFTAVDQDGEDASEVVLSAEKSTHDSSVIKPYLIGGVSGSKYIVKCAVTTADGDAKSFYLKWYCLEKAV